jgi:flagellar protein FliS
MTAAGCASYRNVIANTTKSKEEILLMLYEDALIAIRIAQRGIEEKNPKLKGENISKVLAILTELGCALDMEKGGELAANMAALYRYAINRLVTANIKNDLEPLVEVERLIGELYEGFQGAAKQLALGPVHAKNTTSEITEGLNIEV